MGSIQGHIHNGNECHELGPNWMAEVFPSYFSRLMFARGGGGVGVEIWLWTGT